MESNSLLRLPLLFMAKTKPLRIGIIHPHFFGITGGDKLILDAAIALQNRGHFVTIYTTDFSFCEETFCSETLDVNISSCRTLLPSNIKGRGCFLMHLIKDLILTLYFLFSLLSCDMIFSDGNFIFIFVIKIVSLLSFGVKKPPFIVSYCHFPQIADTPKSNALTNILYKTPLYWIEKKGFYLSDKLFANSGYTKSTIQKHCPEVEDVGILYPGIPSLVVNQNVKKDPVCDWLKDKQILCSINRIHACKNIERVIYLAAEMKKVVKSPFVTTIIGRKGKNESVEFFEFLKQECLSFNLEFAVANKSQFIVSPKPSTDVLFVFNGTNAQKKVILNQAKACFYTASFEHFGMGIAEAMLTRTFAIAMASGGPLEIIQHTETGYLIQELGTFTIPKSLLKFLKSLFDENEGKEQVLQMIEKGYEHASKNFTIKSYTDTLLKAYQHHLAKD